MNTQTKGNSLLALHRNPHKTWPLFSRMSFFQQRPLCKKSHARRVGKDKELMAGEGNARTANILAVGLEKIQATSRSEVSASFPGASVRDTCAYNQTYSIVSITESLFSRSGDPGSRFVASAVWTDACLLRSSEDLLIFNRTVTDWTFTDHSKNILLNFDKWLVFNPNPIS